MNIVNVLQIVVALGLLNVWLLRYGKSTSYRGGAANNLKEEFAAYVLPPWFHNLIGALKITAAIALIGGLWFSSITFMASSLVVILMLGALSMHLKIRDPLRKSIPALLMLGMSLAIAVSSSAT